MEAILVILAITGWFLLPYILWYKAKSTSVKLLWFILIVILPIIWPVFIFKVNKGKLNTIRKVGMTATYVLLVVGGLMMFFLELFKGATGNYNDKMSTPLTFEKNMTACEKEDTLKYWNYMVSLPKDKVIYQNYCPGMDIYSYRMAYQLDTVPEEIEWQSKKDKSAEDKIILKNDAYGRVYARQDSIFISLINAKYSFIHYKCSDVPSEGIEERIYWDETKRILYYEVVFNGS